MDVIAHQGDENSQSSSGTANMISAFDSPKYSDFGIKCRDKQWKVHRVVLASQSDYFAQACGDDFLEGEIGELDLSAEDPAVVEAMLRFLYGQPIIGQSGIIEATPATFQHLQHVYSSYLLGDEYLIPRLKDSSISAMKTLAAALWEEHAFIDICEAVFGDNEHYICNAPLRQVLAKIIQDHYVSYMKDSNFRQRLAIFPEVAVALAANIFCNDSTFNRHESMTTVRCEARYCVGATAGVNNVWSYRNGPDWLIDTRCVWCCLPKLSLVQQQQHHMDPDANLARLKCTLRSCPSDGKTWELLGGPQNERREKPKCLWCGDGSLKLIT